jgi:hypothetical protein
MEDKFVNETAKYIFSVIKASQAIYFSWGTHSVKTIIFKEMAALLFTVNGFIHKGDVIINIDLDETVAAFGNGGRDVSTLVIEDVSYYHNYIAKTIAEYGIPFNRYFSSIHGGLYYSIHAIDFEFVKSLFPTLKIHHDTHKNEVGYLSWSYNGLEHCLYLSEMKLTKSKKRGL